MPTLVSFRKVEMMGETHDIISVCGLYLRFGVGLATLFENAKFDEGCFVDSVE
jgi:hypothetical protein